MLQEEKGKKQHTVHLIDCQSLSVSGVLEVVSFDEEAVILITECGTLQIEGNGLNMTLLDLGRGEVAVDGRVSAFFYTKPKEKSARLFRKKGDV